ncbi:MAG: hypothetical protein H7068_02355 [Pedobacter sp.]|nr:hypothetical protein [Chitinophagaceae bacterium]
MQKLFIFIISLMLCSSEACFSQSYLDENKIEKYSLSLSPKWMSKKIVYALSNIIDVNVPSFKDKQLCINCDSIGYEITLFVGSVKIVSKTIDNTSSSNNALQSKSKDSYTCNIIYNFNSYVVVDDKFTNTKSKIILVDSSEYYQVSRKFSIGNGQTNYEDVTTRIPVSGNTGYNNEGNRFENSSRQTILESEEYNPEIYVKKNANKMFPSELEINEIVKWKILNLAKRRM